MREIISVIIPVYNVERYIKESVDSVLNQTYPDLEIILVDDGSPDNCGKICDEYAQVDSRVKVIHKINGGLSDARNVAIEKATGEWITFIDSDDYVAPIYIETLYNLAIVNKCECSVVQPYIFIDGIEPKVKRQNSKCEIMSNIQAISSMFYQTKLDTSAWNKLYHRSLFKTGIRYPNGYLFEDNPTTFRLLYECKRVVVSQQKLYYYRIRKDSIEGCHFTDDKLNQGLAIIKMMENYPHIISQVDDSFKCKQASLAFHFLMKMPPKYDKKGELWYYVCQNRKSIIGNSSARLKTRIACLLSYFGVNVLKYVFAFISKRN